MSQIQQRSAVEDVRATAVDDVLGVLELYKDPKNPDSIRRVATIGALFRASCNAENNLSWGEAITPGVRLKLALFCMRHGFDMASNHVYVLGGRPYVSIEGRMFLANSHRDDAGKATFQGFAYDRVMNEQERADYEVPKGAIGWVCAVERSDCKHPFVGVAFAGGEGETNPVAKGKDRLALAKKRSNEKALRLAYPLDAAADEGDMADFATPKPIEATVVPNNPATPASPATIVEPTPKPAADPLAEARERFKALNKRHPAIAAAQRAAVDAAGAKLAQLDLAAMVALCDAIEAEANSPALAEARGEIRSLRLSAPEAFNAVLARTVAIAPDFAVEKCTAEDAASFLEDLRVEAAKGGAQ